MTEARDETEGLTLDELDDQDAEVLPEREAMSLISPPGDLGEIGLPPGEFGLPPPRD